MSDDSGELRVTFSAGHGGTDIQPGQVVRLTGKARQTGNRAITMSDPSYRIIDTPEEISPSG